MLRTINFKNDLNLKTKRNNNFYQTHSKIRHISIDKNDVNEGNNNKLHVGPDSFYQRNTYSSKDSANNEDIHKHNDSRVDLDKIIASRIKAVRTKEITKSSKPIENRRKFFTSTDNAFVEPIPVQMENSMDVFEKSRSHNIFNTNVHKSDLSN